MTRPDASPTAALDPEGRRRLLDRRVLREGSQVDEFAGREPEMRRYLERATGRFASTLEAAGELTGSVALELGADPWLFTQLLLERGCRVVSAGEVPRARRSDPQLSARHRVQIDWDGRSERIDHHVFDAEGDRWPFKDGAFTLVFCTEVLEHLTVSPAHLLFETCRVLAPGGRLVLTTPNALSAPKLWAMVRGRAAAPPYSGYGPSGRHNREFTRSEVRELLGAAGFSPRVWTENIEGYEASGVARTLQHLAAVALPERRDHIVAVARRSGPPRYVTPAWLYRSVDRARMRREGVVFPDEPAAR